MSQLEKILSRTIIGGLLFVPVIPLIVISGMYFPFITGKNFVFRILIEIIAVLWVGLITISPSFRPKISLLIIIYSAFVGSLTLAAVFGIDPYQSFFSSYERMEGLFGHLHFFLYFLILGCMFVKAKDWRIFFNISIAVSAIITVYAFLQIGDFITIHQGGTRVDATFGNAIYLAVYLLFHLFLIAIYFFQAKTIWVKFAYGALFFSEAVVLYYTASRGPLISFLAGIAVSTVILAVLEKGRVRQLATLVVVIIFLIPAVFLFIKDTEVVHSNDTLSRFVNMFNDPAAQGRLTIWKMALRAWWDRPIIGWGQENFVYIFSKYYEPSLWQNEPWFDRAHNVFLDWLTASGIIGLGAYLALFLGALFLCFKSFRAGLIDHFVFAGIIGLFAAYFLQNLLVFDNLTSYILFFGVLAWIHSASFPEEKKPGEGPVEVNGLSGALQHTAENPAPQDIKGAEDNTVLLEPQELKVKFFPEANLSAAFSITMISAIIVGYVIMVFNIKPIMAAGTIINSLIIAYSPNPAGKTETLIGELKYGIGLNTFGTTEIREQASQVVYDIARDPGIVQSEKQEYLEFIIEEGKKQRKERPYDVRAMAFMINTYLLAGMYEEMIAIANEALDVSANRQNFYFSIAEAYISTNRADKAIEALRAAYDLDPMYYEAVNNLAVVLIISGRVKEGEDLVEKRYGTRLFPNAKYVSAYRSIGDLGKTVEVLRKLIASSTAPAPYYIELGKTFFEMGQKEKAFAEFNKAVEYDSRYQSAVQQFIQQVQREK